MTEVYWVAGSTVQFSDDEVHASDAEQRIETPLISAVLKNASARIEWVDQFFWINRDSENLNTADHAVFWKTIKQKPLMKWSGQAGLPHYLIHALSRSILAGDCDMAVIAESEQFSGSAALLVSPKAVGRYNLLPRARVTERWEFGCQVEGLKSLANQVLERIEKNNRHSSEIQLISLPLQLDVVGEAFSQIFPNAYMCKHDPSGATKILFRLNELVNQLEEESLDNGLLVSWAGEELVVVSWIERV